MLPLKLVEEVRQLLDEGQLSQRKIAAQLRVSRGTVSALANGKRGLYGREPDPFGDLNHSVSPPERCPGCGARVFLPCVLCRVREHTARQQASKLLRPHDRAA